MGKIILIFVILIGIQAVYSFLFPIYDIDNPYWKSIQELGFIEGHPLGSFDGQIAKKIYPLISDYRINGDAGGMILLARDFPQYYFRGHFAFIDRPLYAFLVFLTARPMSLISDSYSATFAAGIFLNFVIFFFTVFLFYLLVKKIISSRVAFLSSVLLIFSPFAHIWLVQPETNIFGAFSVISSLYLLYNYAVSPSTRKLIIFSLIIGLLMLGKMLFFISFFILILAVLFRRFKEGILFLAVHLVPLGLWYFLVNGVFKFNNYLSDNISLNMYLAENWLINIFQWPWHRTFKIFLDALPKFISSAFYGFLALPVIFALAGFRKLSISRKNLFCSGFIFSFFALIFAMNYYSPRHSFLLFPIVYPLAVLGIDRVADFLRKYKKWYAVGFYLITFTALIIISSINILKVFPYNGSCCSWLF